MVLNVLNFFRRKIISMNSEKATQKERDFHNSRAEVCEQLNESSRLSKKMHRNCYDPSQGKHYSKGFFEKFPYANDVTSLEPMNNCSSLDVSVYRMKNQQTKPTCKKYKNNSNNVRANRKGNKLSSTSLVVNCSPESDFDSYKDKHKISLFERSYKKQHSNLRKCSSESTVSNDDNYRGMSFL